MSYPVYIQPMIKGELLTAIVTDNGINVQGFSNNKDSRVEVANSTIILPEGEYFTIYKDGLTYVYDVAGYAPFRDRLIELLSIFDNFSKSNVPTLVRMIPTFPISSDEELDKYFNLFKEQGYMGYLIVSPNVDKKEIYTFDYMN